MNTAQRQAAADPQTRPNIPGCESACRLPESHTHNHHLLLLLSPESWYSFYRPTEGRRLSRPRHCSKCVQPVPKAVYRSGFYDKHGNCPRWDSNLGPLTPQSGMLPLEHCDLQPHYVGRRHRKTKTTTIKRHKLRGTETCQCTGWAERKQHKLHLPTESGHEVWEWKCSSFYCSSVELQTNATLRCIHYDQWCSQALKSGWAQWVWGMEVPKWGPGRSPTEGLEAKLLEAEYIQTICSSQMLFNAGLLPSTSCISPTAPKKLFGPALIPWFSTAGAGWACVVVVVISTLLSVTDRCIYSVYCTVRPLTHTF